MVEKSPLLRLVDRRRYLLRVPHHFESTLNLEVSLGIGYEYIRYDKYACPDLCAAWKERESYHYFGPDKFSLSIVYVFN